MAILASWMASFMQLEDGVLPTLISAYCLGAPFVSHPKFPRDILVQFLYPRSCEVVLHVSRTTGPLLYKGHPIMVLLDLTPEILLKQKTLKLITECFKRNNVCFRWLPTSDIIMSQDGSQHWADSLASDHSLLDALGLHLSADNPMPIA